MNVVNEWAEEGMEEGNEWKRNRWTKKLFPSVHRFIHLPWFARINCNRNVQESEGNERTVRAGTIWTRKPRARVVSHRSANLFSHPTLLLSEEANFTSVHSLSSPRIQWNEGRVEWRSERDERDEGINYFIFFLLIWLWGRMNVVNRTKNESTGRDRSNK